VAIRLNAESVPAAEVPAVMMPAVEDPTVMSVVTVMMVTSLCRLSIAGETDPRGGDSGGEKMAKHDASPFAWW
jgi:hypothetical protein